MAISLPRVRIRGLDYVDLDPHALRLHLAVLLRTQHSLALFTPNAHIGAACLAEPSHMALLRQGDILLPDGIGVVLASRRQQPAHPLRHRLPGIEAGECVLELCADMGISVFFLGGRPGIAARAAARWRARLPRLRVAGAHDGYFDPDGADNDALTEAIAKSGAGVVIVCLGFPRQERWIIANRPRLPSVHLLMGLGGSLDVWAGELARAPRLFRRAHAEWLWRMMRQPRRLGHLFPMLRYVFSPPIREK